MRGGFGAVNLGGLFSMEYLKVLLEYDWLSMKWLLEGDLVEPSPRPTR